ncbi:hypothetical protein Y032_0044g1068 [Ancylostoma ceylanicum]|uniref:Uncharacterized protein n=1 Tax=Ancylostoma ceylanicum TaxID=53326 RepID=A0A016UDM1_9BILA|nr:hypothetical protein Y032_0044g1068 [Ancylostoma ceylanicum]
MLPKLQLDHRTITVLAEKIDGLRECTIAAGPERGMGREHAQVRGFGRSRRDSAAATLRNLTRNPSIFLTRTVPLLPPRAPVGHCMNNSYS